MPFGLPHPPDTFQANIDDSLRPYINDFAVCYLDDLLIYSTNEKEHKDHIQNVLERLQLFGLCYQAEKWQFVTSEIGFLRFIIRSDGVGMESDRISTIEDWPTPKSIREVQVLLGFTNFYRRFIRKYAMVMTPISDLLQNSPGKWEWTRMAELAFRKLKKAFPKPPIDQHFNLAKPIILQTDPSSFAIAGILNQYDDFGIPRPVNFYLRKCSRAEQNDDRHDRELLAIVETLRQWWHYVEGANHKILIQCNHMNLEYFQTSEVLSWRQARWAEILSSYDFVIQHLEGKKNRAGRPWRRPDYEEGHKRPTARLLANLATTTVNPFNDLLSAIEAAQDTDPLPTDMKNKISNPDQAKTGGQDGSMYKEADMQWKVIAGALTIEGRIYMPDALRNQVISLFHDNCESGHFVALTPAELVSRDFYRLGLDTTVQKYVAGCKVCHQINAPRHPQCGANMPLPPPYNPWDGITIDFVTDLPESTKSGYTGILVIVDQLTKMAIHQPCRQDIDPPELAGMFFGHVICKHGIPHNIVTDRGT